MYGRLPNQSAAEGSSLTIRPDCFPRLLSPATHQEEWDYSLAIWHMKWPHFCTHLSVRVTHLARVLSDMVDGRSLGCEHLLTVDRSSIERRATFDSCTSSHITVAFRMGSCYYRLNACDVGRCWTENASPLQTHPPGSWWRSLEPSEWTKVCSRPSLLLHHRLTTILTGLAFHPSFPFLLCALSLTHC